MEKSSGVVEQSFQAVSVFNTPGLVEQVVPGAGQLRWIGEPDGINDEHREYRIDVGTGEKEAKVESVVNQLGNDRG